MGMASMLFWMHEKIPVHHKIMNRKVVMMTHKILLLWNQGKKVCKLKWVHHSCACSIMLKKCREETQPRVVGLISLRGIRWNNNLNLFVVVRSHNTSLTNDYSSLIQCQHTWRRCAMNMPFVLLGVGGKMMMMGRKKIL